MRRKLFCVLAAGILCFATLAQAQETPVFVVQEPTGSPDLIIQSVSFDPGSSKVKVVIKNIGAVRAGARGELNAFNVGYQWLNAEGVSIGALGAAAASLPANITREINWIASAGENARPPMGTVSIKVTVDAAFAITESNEDNNFWTGPVPKPDLQITSVRLDPNSLKVIATVKNFGTVRAGAPRELNSFNVGYEWLNAEGVSIGAMGAAVANLGAGESREINWTSSFGDNARPPMGAVSVKVTADAANVVDENNETNNTRTATITKPDLRITNLRFSPYSKVIATIKNYGAVRAGAPRELNSFNVSYEWINGEQQVIGSMGAAVANLGPNETRVIDWSSSFGANARSPMGTVAVKVTADAANIIDEGDNENNNSFQTFIPKPDLRVSSISFHPNTSKIKAVIKNHGAVSAGEARELNSFNVSYQWLDAEENVLGSLGAAVATLPAGATREIGWWSSTNVGATPPPGAVSVRVIADTVNAINEGNEDNNSLTLPMPQPDLTIERGAYTTTKLSFTFKNKGLGAAIPPVGQVIRPSLSWVYSDGSIVDFGFQYAGSKTLQANKSVNYSERSNDRVSKIANIIFHPPLGAVSLRINADENNLRESNENNNVITLPIPARLLPTVPVATTPVNDVPGATTNTTSTNSHDADNAAAWERYWNDMLGRNTLTSSTPYGTDTATSSNPDGGYQVYNPNSDTGGTPQDTTPTTPTPTTPTPTPSTPTPATPTPSTPTPATPSASSAPAPTPIAANPSALPRAHCMVNAETNPTTANADLIIKSGSVAYRMLNSSLKFTATILNVGAEITGPQAPGTLYLDADSGDSDFYLCIDTNNDGLYDYVRTSYNGPVDAGHFAYTSALWPTPIRGTHRYEVCADGGNKVIETNENNNCYTGTFTFPLPSL